MEHSNLHRPVFTIVYLNDYYRLSGLTINAIVRDDSNITDDKWTAICHGLARLSDDDQTAPSAIHLASDQFTIRDRRLLHHPGS